MLIENMGQDKIALTIDYYKYDRMLDDTKAVLFIIFFTYDNISTLKSHTNYIR